MARRHPVCINYSDVTGGVADFSRSAGLKGKFSDYKVYCDHILLYIYYIVTLYVRFIKKYLVQYRDSQNEYIISNVIVHKLIKCKIQMPRKIIYQLL